VVGVVGDTRQQRLNDAASPMFFAPYAQGLFTTPHLVMRAAGNADTLPETMRRLVAARDPELPVHDVRAMEEYVALSMARPRFSTLLLSLFALLGLGLSATGLYGWSPTASRSGSTSSACDSRWEQGLGRCSPR
jgi:hypothetical protein